MKSVWLFVKAWGLAIRGWVTGKPVFPGEDEKEKR
jgi:hypothetical protein